MRGVIAVYPDGFCDAMFASLLVGRLSETLRALLSRAKQPTGSSAFQLFDGVLVLP